nr:MATE family efflux transporter [uncultured Clostridium sp.]
MSRVKDMTQGKPAKLILFLTFPLILGNWGQQLYMIADAAIVGRGIGVKALAAIGATDWTYWLILWVIQALTQGFATCVAHHLGEANQEKLKKTVTMSVLLCLIIGIILTIIGLTIAYPVLSLLRTPGDIYDGAVSYLCTMYLGTLIVMAYNMAAAILRALGNGKSPLVAVVIAGIINIILDLLFVMVFRWGIMGAAAATLIAQLFAFMHCLYVMRKVEMLQMNKKDWKPDWIVIGELCSMGLPLALQHVVIVIGGMILQSSINNQGFVFVAGFTATNKVYGLMESSAFSLGYAATTYIAQNYGAGLHERIHKGMKSIVIIAVLMSFVVSATMILGGKYILQLFVSTSEVGASEVLQIAYRYLVTMCSLLTFLYLLHGCRSLLQGLGNAVVPMISGFLEFAIRVIVSVELIRIWGPPVIFFAEPLAWIGAAAVVIAGCVMKLKKITFQNSALD